METDNYKSLDMNLNIKCVLFSQSRRVKEEEKDVSQFFQSRTPLFTGNMFL